MNKCESVVFMEKLLSKYNLKQTKLAKELGTTRQYINSLVKGTRSISREYMLKITALYPMPEYDELNSFVAVSYLDSNQDKLYLDRKLLQNKNGQNINIDSCKLINIVSDAMSPDYILGDRAIIDTSVKHFIDSQIFVFTMCDNIYIRRVNVMPNQIKCTANNAFYDTFYLQQGDDYTIIGALVPRIRL